MYHTQFSVNLGPPTSSVILPKTKKCENGSENIHFIMQAYQYTTDTDLEPHFTNETLTEIKTSELYYTNSATIVVPLLQASLMGPQRCP